MGERRKRRGRDPQGAAWTGNNCLDAQVLRVLIKDPFPRGGDEACHFDVAPGMRAKVQQAFGRLIVAGKAQWTSGKESFLVATAAGNRTS